MSDTPDKPPRVRHRVEAALKAKHHAIKLRRLADLYGDLDPTGAREELQISR